MAGHLGSVDASSLTLAHVSEPLDRGFLARLREVVRKAGDAFEAFEFANALQEIEEFFWADFCDNYLELVKARAYASELTPGKRSALATLRSVLSIQVRLFAPYLPFLTEEIWSWLFVAREGCERSVHTSPWPTVEELSAVASPSEKEPYGAAVEVLREIRRVKGEAKVSMKTPLQSLEIKGASEDLKAIQSVLADLLAVSEAASAELVEGMVEGGRFKVNATLKS